MQRGAHAITLGTSGRDSPLAAVHSLEVHHWVSALAGNGGEVGPVEDDRLSVHGRDCKPAARGNDDETNAPVRRCV